MGKSAVHSLARLDPFLGLGFSALCQASHPQACWHHDSSSASGGRGWGMYLINSFKLSYYYTIFRESLCIAVASGKCKHEYIF